ncbi:uncharacterized protein LOC124613154 [Schistocerca americana]|uniref:uncharacterized protein LOC124613154 n=1 Tax=Schistocerca americana TaxID=7009 RepID=UPI001F4FC10B|nr:uncharacterized protein LOC124613154 [Schistocerca americana]
MEPNQGMTERQSDRFRKQVRCEDQWKRNMAKLKRYLSKGLPEYPKWKGAIQNVTKPAASFPLQIMKVKQVIIICDYQNAIKVQGEPNYNSEINLPVSVWKRGKHLGHINSSCITNTVVPINEMKLEDVSKLLEKHYCESWRESESLSWYMTLLGSSGSGASVKSECLAGEDEDIVPDMMY